VSGANILLRSRWTNPIPNETKTNALLRRQLSLAFTEHVNVAIWPEFVDSSLRLKSVRYVLVEAADEAMSSYTFLTISMSTEFSEKNIVWCDVKLSEDRRRSHISLETGSWILGNGFGEIYDLH
jgi:hypothetical protein